MGFIFSTDPGPGAFALKSRKCPPVTAGRRRRGPRGGPQLRLQLMRWRIGLFSRGSHLQLASSTVAVAWTTDGPAAPAGHGRCAGRLFNTGQMISKVAPRVTRPVQDDEQSPVPTVQRRTDSAPKSGSAQRLGVDLSTCSALFLGSGQDRQIQIQCLSRRATDV